VPARHDETERSIGLVHASRERALLRRHRGVVIDGHEVGAKVGVRDGRCSEHREDRDGEQQQSAHQPILGLRHALFSEFYSVLLRMVGTFRVEAVRQRVLRLVLVASAASSLPDALWSRLFASSRHGADPGRLRASGSAPCFA
jgi:hypothetical protein